MVEKPPTRHIACQIKFLSSFWLCQPLLPPHHKVFHPYRFVFFTTRFGFSAAISTANIVKRTGLSSRRKNYCFCGERLWYVLVSACTCYNKWTRDTTRIKLINPKNAIFLADIFVTLPLCPGYYRLSTHRNVGSHEYPGTRLVASFTLYYIQ